MGKPIVAVFAGVLVLLVGGIAYTLVVMMTMSTEQLFKPGVWERSMLFVGLDLACELIVATIAGLVCAMVNRRGISGLVVILVLVSACEMITGGLKESPTAPRPDDVTYQEAMTSVKPSWSRLVGRPIVGVGGLLLGARIGGRSKDEKAN